MPHDKAEVAHWGLGSLPAPHCTATHESEGSALSLAGLRDLPESRNVLSLREGGGLSGLPKAAFWKPFGICPGVRGYPGALAL